MDGREIFLQQLYDLKEGYHELEIDWLDPDQQAAIKEAAGKFEVPEELLGAFAAYRQEYMLEDGRSTKDVFFDDEDVKAGIHNKFYHFFVVFRNLLSHEYEKKGVRLDITIDPSYSDLTYCLITAKNACGSDALPVPVTLLDVGQKAWCSFFADPWCPQSVYAELGRLYEEMESLLARSLMLKKASPYVTVYSFGGIVDRVVKHATLEEGIQEMNVFFKDYPFDHAEDDARIFREKSGSNELTEVYSYEVHLEEKK